MTKFEQFALDQWLSEWPENMTFNEVLVVLHDANYDERVIVLDFIEDAPWPEIANLILDTAIQSEKTFKGVTI